MLNRKIQKLPVFDFFTGPIFVRELFSKNLSEARQNLGWISQMCFSVGYVAANGLRSEAPSFWKKS